MINRSLDHNYLERMHLDSIPYKDLRNDALDQYVPIIEDDVLMLIRQLIQVTKPTTVLELGAAVGYSALSFIYGNPSLALYTIERDKVRIQQCKDNLNQYDQLNQVSLIEGDIFECYDEVKRLSLDLLFIDASKTNIQKMFDLYAPLVKSGGMIITDNVLFQGYVMSEDEQVPKKHLKVARNIRAYNEYVHTLQGYQSSIYSIGDGLMVTIKE